MKNMTKTFQIGDVQLDAIKDIDTLKKGDFIVCDGSFTREPYDKDGTRIWGDAQVNVFSWRMYERKEVEFDPAKDDGAYPF